MWRYFIYFGLVCLLLSGGGVPFADQHSGASFLSPQSGVATGIETCYVKTVSGKQSVLAASATLKKPLHFPDKKNEDSATVFHHRGKLLTCVCDGVGGSLDGEHASRIFMRAIRYFFESDRLSPNVGTRETLDIGVKFASSVLKEWNEILSAMQKEILSGKQEADIEKTISDLIQAHPHRALFLDPNDPGDTLIHLIQSVRLKRRELLFDTFSANIENHYPKLAFDSSSLMNWVEECESDGDWKWDSHTLQDPPYDTSILLRNLNDRLDIFEDILAHIQKGSFDPSQHLNVLSKTVNRFEAMRILPSFLSNSDLSLRFTALMKTFESFRPIEHTFPIDLKDVLLTLWKELYQWEEFFQDDMKKITLGEISSPGEHRFDSATTVSVTVQEGSRIYAATLGDARPYVYFKTRTGEVQIFRFSLDHPPQNVMRIQNVASLYALYMRSPEWILDDLKKEPKAGEIHFSIFDNRHYVSGWAPDHEALIVEADFSEHPDFAQMVEIGALNFSDGGYENLLPHEQMLEFLSKILGACNSDTQFLEIPFLIVSQVRDFIRSPPQNPAFRPKNDDIAMALGKMEIHHTPPGMTDTSA